MDLAISIRFSHLFPEALIEVPRHGILNVHPGSLPRYAGLYAPMRQMADGQAQIGCTVHWIDAGIDTGPVVARGAIAVERERSLIWHVCHSYDRGVDAVLDIVGDLRAGRRPAGQAQDNRERHYHRLPSAVEFEAFRDQGFQLVGVADYEELLAQYGTPPLGAGDLRMVAAARLPA
jgi:methionyl-tRNA formyltransferase